MSFEIHAAVSSNASTVDGATESDLEDTRLTRATSINQSITKKNVDDRFLLSLDQLDSRLFTILSNQSDPDRLIAAKRALESYKGFDWTIHKRVPIQTPDAPNGYERVLVARHEGLYDLLILSWADVCSPIHDHPCERCFLMPLCGQMVENRYEKRDDGSLTLVHSVGIPNGIASWIDDDIGYHSIGNSGKDIACSLHCYIPGFTRPCTIFDPEQNQLPEVGESIRVRSRAATWSVCSDKST